MANQALIEAAVDPDVKIQVSLHTKKANQLNKKFSPIHCIFFSFCGTSLNTQRFQTYRVRLLGSFSRKFDKVKKFKRHRFSMFFSIDSRKKQSASFTSLAKARDAKRFSIMAQRFAMPRSFIGIILHLYIAFRGRAGRKFRYCSTIHCS